MFEWIAVRKKYLSKDDICMSFPNWYWHHALQIGRVLGLRCSAVLLGRDRLAACTCEYSGPECGCCVQVRLQAHGVHLTRRCAVDHDRQRRDEADLAGHQWGRAAGAGGEGPAAEEGPKQTKSFGLSGLLAAETRMFQVPVPPCRMH
jgi:hypothetical protein